MPMAVGITGNVRIHRERNMHYPFLEGLARRDEQCAEHRGGFGFPRLGTSPQNSSRNGELDLEKINAALSRVTESAASISGKSD